MPPEVPDKILSARLLIRPPGAGDGAIVNAAICESFEALHQWMPWAAELPTPEQSEEFARESARKYAAREDLPMFLFERSSGAFVGATGFHRIDWEVPSLEIGYWCRTSRVSEGFISESTYRLAEVGFSQLGARRIELRTDDRNTRSRAIAKRLGFSLEGVLRNDSLGVDGTLRSTCVYSAVSIDELAAP